jgi:hypothetical protein
MIVASQTSGVAAALREARTFASARCFPSGHPKCRQINNA